jgi:hypothetical protein
MKTYPEHTGVPPELPLEGASFYSSSGLVSNVNVGARGGHEYVVLEYDSNTGETAHTETVVAIKAESPKTPTTSLSRSSGLQLERVGEWIFAFEPERRVGSDEIDGLIDDVLKLLEYAKTFPQNL